LEARAVLFGEAMSVVLTLVTLRLGLAGAEAIYVGGLQYNSEVVVETFKSGW